LRWPVDCHVHFHDLVRVGPSLDAAASNFRLACGRSSGLLGFLLLAQGARERVFEAMTGRTNVGNWAISPVPAEPETLVARKGPCAVVIVCGRQVRAADGLEVLAIGTRAAFDDGQPFRATLDSVVSSGAVAVVPWGFGKWVGRRGRRVAETLRGAVARGVFVGDNGSRLATLGMPAPIKALEQRGARILPGTDPFPIAVDHRRIGGFGLLADVEPDAASPWGSLRSWIMAQSRSPPAYGRASGLARFARLQVGIQLYNRLSNSRSA